MNRALPPGDRGLRSPTQGELNAGGEVNAEP
jgi:hypothetical protein